MKLWIKILFIVFCGITAANGQGYIIDGFVFESGNRGYIGQAEIEISDAGTGQVYCKTVSDAFGQFVCDLPPLSKINIKIHKQTYKNLERSYEASELKAGEKNFLKFEMTRAPGYLFEITVAEKRENVDQVVPAINDYLVEVYNNTIAQEVMKLEHHKSQEFKVSLEKGNHYTILIRKENYFAKQMEVYVNVKGCILCFEGISKVQPGVTDNLTAGNEYGVLLANVELEKIYSGKSLEVKNVLYELGSAVLTKEAKAELDKVITLLKYNPNLSVQLLSHTDSRGSAASNMDLSERRAASAVQYIRDKGSISALKIQAVGMGETEIKNECKEGVVCTEAQHAINRRTEVKIVSISDEWIYKPLVNIKNEEAFEKMLLQAESSGVEQVSGDQLMGKSTNQEVPKSVDTPASIPMVEDLENGYKILLTKSSSSLPDENKFVNKDYKVVKFKDAFGLLLYLVDGFDDETKANNALTSAWQTVANNAKVVLFKDGRIVE